MEHVPNIYLMILNQNSLHRGVHDNPERAPSCFDLGVTVRGLGSSTNRRQEQTAVDDDSLFVPLSP